MELCVLSIVCGLTTFLIYASIYCVAIRGPESRGMGFGKACLVCLTEWGLECLAIATVIIVPLVILLTISLVANVSAISLTVAVAAAIIVAVIYAPELVVEILLFIAAIVFVFSASDYMAMERNSTTVFQQNVATTGEWLCFIGAALCFGMGFMVDCIRRIMIVQKRSK